MYCYRQSKYVIYMIFKSAQATRSSGIIIFKCILHFCVIIYAKALPMSHYHHDL